MFLHDDKGYPIWEFQRTDDPTAQYADIRVEFIVYEISAWSGTGDKTPLYETWPDGMMIPAAEPQDDSWFVRGSIKWDGCSHVQFNDTEVALHLCGRKDWTALSEMLPKLFEWAFGEMGRDPLGVDAS